MTFELLAVDGRPPAQPEGERAIALPDKVAEDVARLVRGQQQMMSVLLAQQAQIERLNAALLTVRVSRSQEAAIREAIRARSAAICDQYALPRGAARRVAGAIRVTLREATGARAVGDLAQAQFERAMEIVCSWEMAGAIRRIRREVSPDAGQKGTQA